MMTTVFQRVGPFEILAEIGRGGMAAVYLATDTRTDRRVALKLVPTGSDREALEILSFGPDDIPWDELAFPSTELVLQDWVSLMRGLEATP